MSLNPTALSDRIHARRSPFETQLDALVKAQSVAATADAPEALTTVAEAALGLLEEAGLEADLLSTPGFPLVHGVLDGDPEAPTVTLYQALDTRQAPALKTRNPYQLHVEQNRFFGCGVAQGKGATLAALEGALAARELGVPLNVHFLLTTEHTLGAPQLSAALERHQARLTTDAVMLGMGQWLESSRPATPSGTRGYLELSLSLRTADGPLRDQTGIGAVRNPLAELTALMAEMVDAKTGQPKVPGLRDEVEDMTIADAQQFALSGFSVDSFKTNQGVKLMRYQDPLEAMEALWVRPSIEFISFKHDAGPDDALPGWAEARIACYLVPRMTVRETMETLTNFIRGRLPEAVITLKRHSEPHRVPQGPTAQAVKNAYKDVFGVRPALIRSGTPIAEAHLLSQYLHAPTHYLATSHPEHQPGGAGENWSWQHSQKCIELYAQALSAFHVALLPPQELPQV